MQAFKRPIEKHIFLSLLKNTQCLCVCMKNGLNGFMLHGVIILPNRLAESPVLGISSLPSGCW